MNNVVAFKKGQQAMFVQGLLSVAHHYDSFVFDQFGVLHNNAALYPNVIDVLQQLNDDDKKVLVLSNSGRSGISNLHRIVGMGIAENLIGEVVTSGDVARVLVLPRYVRDVGMRCLQLSSPNEDPAEVTSAVPDLRRVDDISDCDFVYLSGMPEGLTDTWQQDLLPLMIETKVPLLCSNPDFVAPGGDGLATSAGTIAQAYKRAGGPVELVGKPRALVYDVVRQKLADAGCRSTLFVGDSWHHDILGARTAGFDAFQVMTGVHQALFGEGDPVRIIERELAEDGIMPTWVSENL
jgi:HAD superfamily hydrolase (TIGR01459 family)